MDIRVLNSLEKVFSDEKPLSNELKEFSMLKNERSSFIVSFSAECDSFVSIKISGELADCSKVYLVKNVPVGLACFDNADDFYLRKTSGTYPDYIVPVSAGTDVKKGEWTSFWIEVIPDGKHIGSSKLTVELSDNNGNSFVKEVKIEVIDALLPEQKLIYTNWFHCDCLCNFYNVEPFSDEFWRISENYIKTAAEHGMNCILTPVFTPPLDTKVGGERRTVQLVKVRKRGGKYSFNFSDFRKWINICRKCGVEYFEISHLFTQWGAKHAPKIVAIDRKGREKKIFGWFTKTSSREYDEFLKQFADAFIKTVEKEGIKDKCLLHVSDEPHLNQLNIYKKRAKLIKELFTGFKVYDALSDFEFYKTGALKNPVPCEHSLDDFAGNVDELWTYYCCGQGDEYLPNRFISMPSLRNRVLGVILYKYNISGFLQWGYNFYNTQYSIKAINPYEVTDAGGAFPSGDSFFVYPAENGEAISSLRLKVFYDGIQDMLALRLLESKIGRDKVINLIESDLSEPLTVRCYPHNNDWLLELREKINRLIKES